MALAAISPEAVVLLLMMYFVSPLVCADSVFVLVLLFCTLCSFSVANILFGKNELVALLKLSF